MATWDPVPRGFVHGILLGYKVFYRRQRDENSKFINVTTKNRQHELRNMDKYTLYIVKVLAFTVKGDGVTSLNVTKRTDEDG